MSGSSNLPYRPEPLTATRFVEWMEEVLETGQGSVLRRFKMMDYVRKLLDPDAPLGEDIEVPSQEMADSLRLSASDYAILLNWRKTKVLYDVDPTLMTTLEEMDTTDVLPGEVFRHLPHPNPLFVFTAGKPITMEDGSSGVLRAMFVTGRTVEDRLCSTHADEATQYQLTFISDITDASGEVVDVDLTRLSFVLGKGSTTIRKVVDEVLSKGFTQVTLSGRNSARLRSLMEEMAQFGITHLLYVCSEKSDTVKKPVGRKPAKKGGARPPKPIQLHQVGWHVGPAIKEAHERVEREEKASGGTGRTVRPHVRRAHLHTFAHGKGRALRKVKWLPPNIINAKGDEEALDGTIVPVEK